MPAEAWATLAGAAVVLIIAGTGGIAWIVRLEGRLAEHRASVESRIASLEQKAKEHGDVRDLVIEMKTEMRGVQRSLEDLAKSLKEITLQRRSVQREG